MNNAKNDKKNIDTILIIFISIVIATVTVGMIVTMMKDEKDSKLPNGMVYTYIESEYDGISANDIYENICEEYPLTTMIKKSVWEREMKEANYTRADLDGLLVSLDEVLTRKDAKILVITYSDDATQLVDTE